MASDILVKISADGKQFSDEIDKIQKKTEDLSDGLSDIAKAAGAVFAGLVASAGVAIKQFRDSEKASIELTNALENQGLQADKLSKSYKELADEVSKKTGIDDDAIVSAQALLQTYIGQTEITGPLTKAVADLSTKTGSLESAAELLGRAYQGNITAFQKMGIKIDENASAQQRLDQAIAGVNQRLGGQAEALAQGTGSFAKTQVAIGNVVEQVGKRLAPTFEKINTIVTEFFRKLEENEILLDFAVEIGKIVAIGAGFIATLASVGLAIVKFNSILAIAKVAVTSFGLASKVAVGATGIGLLIVVATEVYQNWNKIWPAMKGILFGALASMGLALNAFATILGGVFTGKFSEIKRGFEDLKSSLGKGIDIGKVTAQKTAKELEEPKQDPTEEEKKKQAAILAEKRKGALAVQAEQARIDDLNKQQTALAVEIAVGQAKGAAESVIKLKQQEKDILAQLENEKNADIRAALQERLAIVQQQEIDAAALAAEQKAAFQNEILAKNEEYNALEQGQREKFLQQNQQALIAAQETAKTAQNKIALQALQEQQAANARYLQEQQKFGTAYADINRIIYSDKVKAAKDTSGELAALAQSENSTLKAIGKAAAVTQITISTAEAAMKVYAGFQSLPFGLGIPLGIAAAAAVTAFGAERIGKVLSAQSGGIVPGIQKGGDSVPALLQPGELVVPRQSFSQITQAIANRAIANDADTNVGISTPAGASEGPQMIAIGFDGPEAEKVITARRVEARALGVLRESTA